jgi:hypothetical protein
MGEATKKISETPFTVKILKNQLVWVRSFIPPLAYGFSMYNNCSEQLTKPYIFPIDLALYL